MNTGKSNALGAVYSIVHFLLEVTSFFIVTSYTKSELVWILAFMYDFLAFAPQGLFGLIRDKGIKINLGIIGTALTTCAVLMMIMKLNPIAVILVLSVGNCMVHIQGAEVTLRGSEGKITPSAVFVAGGSFGVITGKLLSQAQLSPLLLFGANAVGLILIFFSGKLICLIDDKNLNKYNFANKNASIAAVIILAVLVVAVRSYMGYGIPTAWNTTALDSVLLFSFMGVGKAVGGILTDTIGIKPTAFISVICALPLLILGNNNIYISLLGITMFSMTMAVTLAVLVSVIPRYPGVAFGLTTLGLFLGMVLIMFYRVDSFMLNTIIITVLSVLCFIILNYICKRTDKNAAKFNENT